MKLKPTIISIFILCGLVATSFFRTAALAVETNMETPFGGMWIMTLNSAVCDCNMANVHVILDYRTMTEMSLYQAPNSVIYSNYNTSGTYQLGTYTTNTQDCMMYVYYECETIWYNDHDYGMMPGTGTALE